MNTTKTKYEEALKIALEALEVSKPSWAGGKFLDDRISKHNDTIDVLRKLLAQPDIKHSNECIKNNWQVCSCGVEKTQPEQRSVSEQQEPVGEAYLCEACNTPFDGAYECPSCGHNTAVKEPVYITSPQRTWVGLTDDELNEIVGSFDYRYDVAKAVEAKLKAKNERLKKNTHE